MGRQYEGAAEQVSLQSVGLRIFFCYSAPGRREGEIQKLSSVTLHVAFLFLINSAAKKNI